MTFSVIYLVNDEHKENDLGLVLKVLKQGGGAYLAALTAEPLAGFQIV